MPEERVPLSGDQAEAPLFTRESVLAGFPARQLRTLLFLIESRTARLAAQVQEATEEFPSEQAAEARELDFLEAFSLGRDPPVRPTIQDLERYADQWAPLVPDSPRMRAGLAHLMAEKYAFTHRAVPGVRAALALDDEAVQQAYRDLYGQPLETIFVPQLTLPDRLRWASTAVARWVESLPPFWAGSLLIVTQSLPVAWLVLPIAVAGLGLWAALALTIAIGLVNVLTMACMAEAAGRTGSLRYGHAFVGRVVSDYLGRTASSTLSGLVAASSALYLLASYLGLAVTLMSFTAVPASAWAVLLLLLALYLLRGQSVTLSIGVLVL